MVHYDVKQCARGRRMKLDVLTGAKGFLHSSTKIGRRRIWRRREREFETF